MLASPMAIIYAFGIWMGKRRHGVILIGALFVIFLGLFWVTAAGEMQPNRAVTMAEKDLNITVDQSAGNMEGKETRFGSLLSSLWAISTTSTTNGAVNSMHNSFTPQGSVGPVSYTHLTLPTIYSV